MADAVTLRQGDALFYSGTDPVSREIRRVTNSRFSHCALALCDDYIIEAVQPQVRVARAVPTAALVVSPPYQDEAHALAAVTAALALQNAAYDTLGAGIAGAEDVLRAHLAGLGHALDAIEAHLPVLRVAVFCSRLLAVALTAGGIALTQPPGYPAPGDLAAALTGQR